MATSGLRQKLTLEGEEERGFNLFYTKAKMGFYIFNKIKVGLLLFTLGKNFLQPIEFIKYQNYPYCFI